MLLFHLCYGMPCHRLMLFSFFSTLRFSNNHFFSYILHSQVHFFFLQWLNQFSLWFSTFNFFSTCFRSERCFQTYGECFHTDPNKWCLRILYFMWLLNYNLKHAWHWKGGQNNRLRLSCRTCDEFFFSRILNF